MCKTLNALGSTPPFRLASYAINPEQVIHHYRYLSAGTAGGDRHFPLLRLIRAFDFKS